MSVTVSSQLARAWHLYNSQKYDDALSIFSRELDKDLSSKKRVQALLGVGMCYFHKDRPVAKESVQVLREGFRELESSHRAVTQRMVNRALEFFNSAIQIDGRVAAAHYWKGRSLEYKGEILQAYQSYVQAASLAPTEEYLSKCSAMFDSHPSLPFLKTRSIQYDEDSKLIELTSPYDKVAQCHAILELLTQGKMEGSSMSGARSNLTDIAGRKVFSWYLPGTGDGDGRVRDLARTVLKKIDSYSK